MRTNRVQLLACVVLLQCLHTVPVHAADRVPLTLRVLTYNIHGLPAWIARDAPEARIRALLPKTRAFEVVLLQEDFAYTDLVDALRAHRQHLRAEPADGTPFLRQGTGLTLLADLPTSGAAHATAYHACNGWLSASSDCLANKGTLVQRLRVPLPAQEGATIDVWNTHLDAGRGDEDHAVRVAQLDVLAADIMRNSAGQAVIVGGDFNLHWDVPRDRALLRAFASKLGLALAARVPDDGGRKRVDYLLYRASSTVGLRVRDAGVAPGFTGVQGEPLSDHPPVFAEFELR